VASCVSGKDKGNLRHSKRGGGPGGMKGVWGKENEDQKNKNGREKEEIEIS